MLLITINFFLGCLAGGAGAYTLVIGRFEASGVFKSPIWGWAFLLAGILILMIGWKKMIKIN